MIRFEINEEEYKKYKKWIKKHDKTCPYKGPLKQGALGGRLAYTFTPKNMGVIIKVKCACGEEVNLTDVDM